MKRTRIGLATLAAALMGLTAGEATGQATSTFVLAGYGSALYEGATTDGFPNNFSASVSPVMLFTMGDDFLFESELEFGLSGAATTTTLEYAQIDYLGFERAQIIAGKFLLPFGVFGERLHPTWINKLPTGPVLYGHAHGGVAEAGLLPVLSDAGVMLRLTQPMGGAWSLDFSGYVTQGPRLAAEEAADDHDDEEAALSVLAAAAFAGSDPEHGPETIPAPPVAFGTSFDDNNKNKMVGARIGVVKGPSFEMYASAFHAMYDADNFLDYQGGALSAEWRSSGYELRGEGVVTRQEFEGGDHFETLQRSGLYAQVAKRVGPWEPVVRFGWLADGTVDDAEVIAGHTELALGLDYWFQSSIPVKVAWEFHEDLDDRFYLQWAFGF